MDLYLLGQYNLNHLIFSYIYKDMLDTNVTMAIGTR